MIKGFDAAVADMEVGEVKDIHLMTGRSIRPVKSGRDLELEIEQLPGSEDLTVGQQVYLTNQMGQPIPCKSYCKDREDHYFDANHEMAGKELNFRIELVEVK